MTRTVDPEQDDICRCLLRPLKITSATTPRLRFGVVLANKEKSYNYNTFLFFKSVSIFIMNFPNVYKLLVLLRPTVEN